MKALVKISTIFLLIFLFLGVSALLSLFIGDYFRLQKKRTMVQSFFCRLGLKVLGVRVRVDGKVPRLSRLMVGNHMSYLDILVLSSIYSSSYVTSQEIREMAFLGSLCKWAGCLFVERRNRENLSNEVREIKEALESGLMVTIFPEATSTNGEAILRFRSPLYQAAVDGGVEVQSFCLNYRSVSGQSFSLQNRDLVCWYGDMDFLPHLWRLCLQKSVEVSVDFLPSVSLERFNDNKEIAAFTQKLVTERFLPVG